ncbi:MAG: hypothetical protein IJW78_00260 [Clostridia bacterium]|nr:hypothetical protein [Clostridia bacterium]
MRKMLKAKSRRVCAMLLTVALVISAVCSAVIPAIATTGEADYTLSYTQYTFDDLAAGEYVGSNVYAETAGTTLIADKGSQSTSWAYAASIFPTKNVVTEAEGDNYLAIDNGSEVGRAITFDAGGDIDTYSFDMKITNGTQSPDIVYYWEDYKYTVESAEYTANAMSYCWFQKYADATDTTATKWRLFGKGLARHGGADYFDSANNQFAFDWANKWATVKFTYGTEYYDQTKWYSGNGGHNQDGALCANTLKAQYCKYITKIEVIDKETGSTLYAWSPETVKDTNGVLSRWSYGVNKNVLGDTAADNATVSVGFTTYTSTSRAASIDNITVVNRGNVEKVIAAIDAIGNVDGSAECIARIETARDAYDKLAEIAPQRVSEVTNYSTLTDAETSVSAVSAVIEKINAIGTVTYTTECKAKLDAAQAAYDNLSDTQKAGIASSYATLEAAWAAYNALAAEAEKNKLSYTKYTFDDLTVGSYTGTNVYAETAGNTLIAHNMGNSTSGWAKAASAFPTKNVVAGTTEGDNYLAIDNGTEVSRAIYFDAPGNIDTYSFDMKITNGTQSPEIVFYREDYTYGDNKTATAMAVCYFVKKSDGTWRYVLRGNSFNAGDYFEGVYKSFDFDWANKWATVKFTYGTEYVDFSDAANTVARDGATAANGDTTYLYNKYITKVEIIDKETGTTLYTFDTTYYAGSGSASSILTRSSYGVNKNLLGENAKDNDTVSVGFSTYSSSSRAASIDNITIVGQGNVEKVIGLIDAIGTVEHTDACKAKVAAARTAYDELVSIAPQRASEVTNYSTLTDAETFLSIDPVDYAVGKINDIGEVEDNSAATKAKLDAAQEAYDALTDTQKADAKAVAAYATLQDAWATYNAFNEYGITPSTTYDFDDLNAGVYSGSNVYAETSGNSLIVDSGQQSLTWAKAATAFTTQNVVAGTDGDNYLALDNSDNYYSAVQFDAGGDIASYSFDMKITNGTQSPDIVYYREDYTYGDNLTANAMSYCWFQKYADATDTTATKWRLIGKGLARHGGSDYFDGANNQFAFDWANKWATVKFTYGTEYYDLSSFTGDYNYDVSNGPNVSAKTDLSKQYCKYITKIEVIDKETGALLYSWSPETVKGTNGILARWSYGVNKNLLGDTAADNATVSVGFAAYNTATNRAASIDNLSVAYRNTEALADLEEQVAAQKDIPMDNTAATGSRIAAIEKAYGLLSGAASADLATKITVLTNTYATVTDAAYAPVVTGASIRVNSDPTKQNICYNVTAPSAQPLGWNMIEYGSIITRAQDVSGEFTIDTPNVVTPSKSASSLPAEGKWTSKLLNISNSFGDSNVDLCAVKIAARAFVKYITPDGYLAVIYSSNDVAAVENANGGVNDGVCVRSVYGIAKTIFNKLQSTKDQAVDPAIVYEGTGITETTVLGDAEATFENVLKFLEANKDRLAALAQ